MQNMEVLVLVAQLRIEEGRRGRLPAIVNGVTCDVDCGSVVATGGTALWLQPHKPLLSPLGVDAALPIVVIGIVE